MRYWGQLIWTMASERQLAPAESGKVEPMKWSLTCKGGALDPRQTSSTVTWSALWPVQSVTSVRSQSSRISAVGRIPGGTTDRVHRFVVAPRTRLPKSKTFVADELLVGAETRCALGEG
jgi:hypothetical protein